MVSSHAVNKLKQMMGLDFAAGDMGVVLAVEEQIKALEEIKVTLGLPPDSDPQKISDAVRALKSEKAGWLSTLFKR